MAPSSKNPTARIFSPLSSSSQATGLCVVWYRGLFSLRFETTATVSQIKKNGTHCIADSLLLRLASLKPNLSARLLNQHPSIVWPLSLSQRRGFEKRAEIKLVIGLGVRINQTLKCRLINELHA